MYLNIYKTIFYNLKTIFIYVQQPVLMRTLELFSINKEPLNIKYE